LSAQLPYTQHLWPIPHACTSIPAHLPLQLAELVAEADEELAIALFLVAGQGQDAGQVVALLTALLLAEVTNLEAGGVTSDKGVTNGIRECMQPQLGLHAFQQY
jgi:hypothetical protein